MELTLGTWRVSVERTAPETTELAAMYDAAAERWHCSVGMLGYSRAYSSLFGRLFFDGTLNYLENGGRVLDCGIGTGALSLGLLEQAPAPLRIEGVDVSERMLDQAQRNLGDAAVDVRLRTADVRSLPFESASFDAVICAHVLEHLDDPLEGISEMVRVLRPGGVLVVVATRRSFSDELLRLRWRYTRVEQERLVGMLEEAGLGRVRCYPLSGGRLPRLGSVAVVGVHGSDGNSGASFGASSGSEEWRDSARERKIDCAHKITRLGEASVFPFGVQCPYKGDAKSGILQCPRQRKGQGKGRRIKKRSARLLDIPESYTRGKVITPEMPDQPQKRGD